MRSAVFIVLLALAGFAVSCSNQEQAKAPQSPPQNTNTAAAPPQPEPQSTPASDTSATTPKPKRPPARSVTRADVAKLYWLEGAWRGTGGPKPFYNRYTFISGTTMKIGSFEDEELTKQVESARYDLKDGMFANPDGKDRFGASEISDTLLELVSLSDNNKVCRMERLDNGTVRATLEWVTDGKAESRSYILEPLKK